jgi:Periplasmic component of the Tol biopolymer transport system
LGFIILIGLTGCEKSIREFSNEDRYASIFPDYNGIVIPPNIAPLNFYIKESGSKYHVEIYSKNGDKLVIQQKSPKILIPVNAWHKLVKQNAGNKILIDIYCKNKKWIKYTSMSDSIASEPIESYLTYRLIGNARAYSYFRKIGLYQRNIENFDESTIFDNTAAKHGCLNCHSFWKADPKTLTIHFRAVKPGTLIKKGDKMEYLKTKTKYTMTPFVYPAPAWHPGGNYLAFSLNKANLNSFYKVTKNIVSEWTDYASDIVVYNLKTNTVTTSPKVSSKSRENLPVWSPDGKMLYFISAPETKKNDYYNQIWAKYSLLRIPYDTATNTWGDIDTVLSSRQTGKSISFPNISPDGRYVRFCMLDHGYFATYDKSSDLYILDLKTNKYHRLNISSNSAESFHDWSQNGRWIVFSSKRLDDIYSFPFIAYFDKNGNTCKPFVLPQKDPLFYSTFLKHFNRPVFVKGKIDLNPRQVRDFIYNTEPKSVIFDSTVDVDALSGATWIAKHKP